MAAVLAHHRGDDAEALRRVGQMLLVGRALDHQPFLTHHLTATACDAVSTMTVADVAPDLEVSTAGGATEAQVRALIHQLLDERPINEGQRRAWVGERVMQLEFPQHVYVGGGGAGSVAFGGSRLNVPGLGFFMKPMIYDNARAMSRYTTATMKAMASSPDLASFRANLGDPAPEIARSPTRYAFASVLVPSLNRAPQAHYRTLAWRRLAATCLAARLYALDHQGALPESLDGLVPAYLPSVPRDPMAGGGAEVRYVNGRADPRRPRVYSVGDDGRDDGGVEADPARPRTRGEARPSDDLRHLRRQPRVTTPE
jgi:hypothetical protein